MEERIKKLISFCRKIYAGETSKSIIEEYRAEIDTVRPTDLFLIMNEQLKQGMSVQEMLVFVDKIVNVFADALVKAVWQRPKPDTFLGCLIAENAALIARLDSFKAVLKARDDEALRAKTPDLLAFLAKYNAHLLKLENILFPYMEKRLERFAGLKVMWALHDEARLALKEANALIIDNAKDNKVLIAMLGRLFFLYYGMVQKQELIMFPAASQYIGAPDFLAMHLQSFDFDFPYIKRPNKPQVNIRGLLPDADESAFFKTETGSLTLKQLDVMINTLPMDVTFVDKDDNVAFFSRPEERLFPRTAAVIGRNVRNCHPPKSVHVVEQILSAFKDGKEDKADFWIKLNGLYALIQYFALRDEDGAYVGTLEVSQEISSIKAIEGEKRLLDWE